MSILGKRVLRTEDPRFLTTGGCTRRTSSPCLPGRTWPPCRREDTGMLNQEMRQQPLATDIVRFVGKAVAAVVT